MTTLADAVLPLIRTRAEVWGWGTANAHGGQMHQAIDLLEGALPSTTPADAYAVVHAALASAVKVIARADDSSGIIGDACRRLLELHPVVAAAAGVTPGKLVDWMIKFQFDGDVDYFEIDPVAYAAALGDKGMAAYRARLDAIRAGLGPEPPESEYWSAPHRHERFVLHWNAQRLAVLDRDVDAIIRTHARDRRVAVWLKDTAVALAEIGEIDLAIDWAKQAADHDLGHQAQMAARYWCDLLAEHRPADELAARLEVFRRWPSSGTATWLHRAAGPSWPDLRDEVITTLSARPAEAVLFSLGALKDARLAYEQAFTLHLDDDRAWVELAKAYQKVDPLGTLPIHQRLVEHELVKADAKHYRAAARRLATMRKIAAGTDHAAAVDDFIARLRGLNNRRPRLQQEFDGAGLP